MKTLDALDQVRGGPLAFRYADAVFHLPEPASLSWQQVMLALDSERAPTTPDMPLWRSSLLFERWVGRHDLPTFGQASRLAWLLDRFYDQIEADLHPVDLGELWRTRQWRLLLNLIDHLPQNTYYAEAMSNDEDYAKAAAKARAEAEPGEKKERPAPPLRTWSPEVGAIADLIDAVRALNHTTAAAGGAGKGLKPPEPYPRPESALAKAQKAAVHERKKAKHEELVKRMLPHKA